MRNNIGTLDNAGTRSRDRGGLIACRAVTAVPSFVVPVVEAEAP